MVRKGFAVHISEARALASTLHIFSYKPSLWADHPGEKIHKRCPHNSWQHGPHCSKAGRNLARRQQRPWYKHSKERLSALVYALDSLARWRKQLQGLCSSRHTDTEERPGGVTASIWGLHCTHKTKQTVTQGNRTAAKAWLWGGKER